MVDVSRDVLEELVRGLLDRKKEVGSLSNTVIGQYATVIGCSPRHVFRLVARAEAEEETKRRDRYELTDPLLDAFFARNGDAKAAHADLLDAGINVPSVRTIQRVIRRELTPAERALAKYGEEARRRHCVYVASEVTHRNELWIGDGKELDTLVTARRGRKPVRPWLFSFLDAYSRCCMGFVVSPMPDAHDVVAALRDAITLQPSRGPFQGLPVGLQYDNALAHLSNRMLEACTLLGIGQAPIPPYSPYLNGKLERFHRTIRDEFSGPLPFFTHAPTGVNREPLHPDGEPIGVGLLVELLMDYVERYNRQRPHRSLGGRTPEQVWLDDPTPIREPDPRAMHLLALPTVQRPVRTRGIEFRAGYYLAPELNSVFGDQVEVRYAPHDDGWVEVFHDGRWLCTAIRSTRLSRSAAGAIVRQRREDNRRADAAMERRLMRDALKLGELKELASLRDASTATGPTADGASKSAHHHGPPGADEVTRRPAKPVDAAAVLEVFGLTDHLNQALRETKEEKDA